MPVREKLTECQATSAAAIANCDRFDTDAIGYNLELYSKFAAILEPIPVLFVAAF
jgi:hypothetical protein